MDVFANSEECLLEETRGSHDAKVKKEATEY